MRLLFAIAITASIAAYPSFAQTAPPTPEPPVGAAPTPEPAMPAGAKSEEDLSGKTPPKNERGGTKAEPKGTETGWSGQWKTPEDGKSQAGRNEGEGQSVKQPEQGK
jgi:hypothetical protein